jgi:5-methyltetrahydrofolate--homocysteine methyltransferase
MCGNVGQEIMEKSDQTLLETIVKSVKSLDFFSMKESIKNALNAGVSIRSIVNKGILRGIEGGGQMGLMLAAEALDGELFILEGKDGTNQTKSRKYSGKVVVGTIKGDIHSLGKKILIAMMKAYGMDIIDLGTDVKPEKFVEAAKDPDVKVIGISYLLSSVEPEVIKAVNLLKNNENTGNNIKVILGGAAVSEEIAEKTNADAFTNDALKGIDLIEKWLSRND